MTVADEIRLTNRQREVLSRFIEGRSVTSIAAELGFSQWTVRTHIADIAKKIDQGKTLTPARRVLLYGAELLAEGS